MSGAEFVISKMNLDKRSKARQNSTQDKKNTEQPKQEQLLLCLDTDLDGGTGGVLVPNEERPHTPQTDTLLNGAPPVRKNILDQNCDTGVPNERENRQPTTSESAVGPTAPVKVTAQEDRDTPNLKEPQQIRQNPSSEISTGPPCNSASASHVQSEISSTPNASSRDTGTHIYTEQNILGGGSSPPQTSPKAMRPTKPSQELQELSTRRPSDDSERLEPQGQGNMSPKNRPPRKRRQGENVRQGAGRSPLKVVPEPSERVGSGRMRAEGRGKGGRRRDSSPRNGSMSDRRGRQAPVKPSSTPEQTPELLSELRFREVEETIREKDEQIFQLKETISHLHRREGDPPKADHELEMGFSGIARSIDQLVLQYCHTPKDPDIESYCRELREKIQQSSCQPNKHLRSGQKVRLISAVLARLLCERVFDGLKSDSVGSRETTKAVELVYSKLNGTPYQHDRWRAVTAGLLTSGDDFAKDFNERVGRITGELGVLLSILAPSEDGNGRRMDALRVIVEQTSKLAVEIRKQADRISLDYKTPGSPYDPQCMEDVTCCYSDAELEALRATVQIHIFPAILRRPCGWDGDRQIEPTVVLKAKVMAEPPHSDLSWE